LAIHWCKKALKVQKNWHILIYILKVSLIWAKLYLCMWGMVLLIWILRWEIQYILPVQSGWKENYEAKLFSMMFYIFCLWIQKMEINNYLTSPTPNYPPESRENFHIFKPVKDTFETHWQQYLIRKLMMRYRYGIDTNLNRVASIPYLVRIYIVICPYCCQCVFGMLSIAQNMVTLRNDFFLLFETCKIVFIFEWISKQMNSLGGNNNTKKIIALKL